ncbi:hypothetical protein PPTG_00348 [Phytophthora nicotianae INRA-310]|uniref:Transposase Tc1-like domain-containing protein n=1 Tax=Phytophthora nicotianae (strain INRA-310) TaxID=761204 RepID=W2REQ6_PHYN3|nr:hypothetical protein PPTG_00348 [Phytophthora nicotianae INRA-310]ETN23842.1 hypothetical protein PPTG_00348 [Phytophthora nicotianae INRA-310]
MQDFFGIKRIWDRYQKNVAQGIADGAPESRIKGNSGRKPYDRSKLATKLKKVPVFQRRRVAATAARIGVSTSLIRSLVDEGYLTRRSSSIKPHLSDNNKIQRMQHTLTFINDQTYQFENMYGMIHIDEKWINEDIDERTFLVLPDQELPERHRQS